MRFRERFPDWADLPTEELLRTFPPRALNALMPRIAEWYQVNLPLWAVLQHLGYDGRNNDRGGPRHPRIGPETDEEQVSCMLPSHDGDDLAPSARYYMLDRNKGTAYGHIFCFGSKCQKAYTSFWYLYVTLKFHRNSTYRDVIAYIDTVFGVPFPRQIALDADPDRLDDDAEARAIEAEMNARFRQAGLLRERVKSTDRAQFLAALSILYTQPLTSSEPAT